MLLISGFATARKNRAASKTIDCKNASASCYIRKRMVVNICIFNPV